jgi:H+-translocating NAD(P) transhydrogenase subunit beta
MISPELERFIMTATGLFAAGCFVLALKWLSAPTTARRGNLIGEIGMLAAVIGALVSHNVVRYDWILVGFFLGAAAGAPMAIWMHMTAVPQRTALSHACGGLAAALVGTAHYYLFFHAGNLLPHPITMLFLCLEVLLGSLTFTGSLMAFGKLQDILPTRPMVYRGQNLINLSVLGLAIISAAALVVNCELKWLFPCLAGLSALFGVMLILPIGGADMPTVIALLNSYAGLSASMMGFVLGNRLLIIAGALDGASGLILSIIMCRP